MLRDGLECSGCVNIFGQYTYREGCIFRDGFSILSD